MIATNAQPILRARLRGLRPADLVIISLVGHVDVANHVVRAMPDQHYDWRWTHILDVCVYVDNAPTWHNTVKAIALQRPAHLCIWNCRSHWGASVYLIPTAEDITRPVHKWTYELDFLPWLDLENCDFYHGRTYARTPGGMPYAVNS